MDRLLCVSHSPFTNEGRSGRSRSLHILLAMLLMMVVIALLQLAPETNLQRYTASVGVQPASKVLGSANLGSSTSLSRKPIFAQPALPINQVPSNEDIGSSTAGKAWNVQPSWMLPLLGLGLASLILVLKRSQPAPEAVPLQTATHHCIAMCSTTSVKPLDETGKAASGPRKRVLVVGPTGYIGKYVTLELIKRGFEVVALSRERSGIKGKKSKEDVIAEFPGGEVVFGDVCDMQSLQKVFKENAGRSFDTVVSCLASRTGGVEDSWKIDYQATSNVLQVARANGVRHFVLLSAICVQKPLLEFQRAKLKFEEELTQAGDITYSIVRPTAFFKSLAGQVKSVMGGGPYVMFGDGQLAACKPISERDLAAFMADCVEDEDKVNKVLPIGGPGEALTPLQQAEILFRYAGKEPKFIKVPVAIMDFVIGVLDFLKQFNKGLVDAAEFGRIGKYYATESMLLYDPVTGKYLPGDQTPSYGQDTLEQFFENATKEGGLLGQELGDAAIFSD